MSQPSQDAIDRARTEAYRLGLTPEQGEILLRTGKTPQQLQAEQAQRRAEIREDIQSFKQEQIGARLRGGELARHEVRRTYDGGFAQRQTLIGERRPAIDTRSDIEIYKDLQAQLRSEGKTFVGPRVQIRRDAETGQVRDIRGRVAPRFAVGDVYLTTSSPRTRPSSRTQAQFTQSDDSVFIAPDPTNPFNIVAIRKSEAKETPTGFEVEFDPTDPRFGLNQTIGYGAAITKARDVNPFIPEDKSATAGFTAVFTDFGKTFFAGFQGLFDPQEVRKWQIRQQTAPKLDPTLEGGAIGAGISRIIEYGTTGQTAQSDKELTQFAEAIRKSPEYFIGSALGSAAFYATPFGVSKVLSRVGVGAAKALPRTRFDFDPRFGSFYDRPSVRFGPYNPTRWENPETLAELNKFRMTIDGPTVKDLITPASLKGFEAFGAGSRSERATIETRSADRSSSLLLEKSLDEATSTPQMVDTKSFAAATEPTRTAATTTRTTSNLIGGGANIFTSTGNLGLFGETGAGRRRRRQDDPFGIDFLIGGIPVPKTGSPLAQFTKQWNPGVITFGERDVLDQGARFRGGQSTRDARAQQNLLAEYQKMFEGTLPRLDTTGALGQALSTETTQRQQQRAAQTQATALSQMLSQITGQATAMARMQSTRPATQTMRRSFLGGFGFPVPNLAQSPRRRKKGKRGARFNELAYLAPDLIEVGYGKELAKAFNKAYGLTPDPYGAF